MKVPKMALKDRIWQAVERRIEVAPIDGMSAEGEFSDRVADVQRAYVAGLRAGRLAAISSVNK
jgi:hypothetical protein